MVEGYANGMNIRNEHPDEEMVTLYFFGVEWCPHCKHAKPEWDAFVEENKSKTKKTKVDPKFFMRYLFEKPFSSK